MNFQQDRAFLLKLNEYKIKKYYAKILILDFETENPLMTFQGKIINGNINASSTSPVRKTGNLTMIVDEDVFQAIFSNNLMANDKKISLSIGIENPFYYDPIYQNYGKELYFQQGIFIITGISNSISNGNNTISMNFIDKMGNLNGVCGGILPATTSFHEAYIQQPNGDVLIEYPLIKDIVFEAVHHFGGEHPSRILIEDIPDNGLKVIKYIGNTPINFKKNTDVGKSGMDFIIKNPPVVGYNEVYYKNNYIGYSETPLTYPGELILKEGSSVAALLDQIVQVLGNYEYFYDEFGIFHFRQIKNFQATGKTPLNYDDTDSSNKELQKLYFPRYLDNEYYNEFSDSRMIISAQFNPKLDNIKNDFIVWGTKDSGTSISSAVRYHLAIDTKPKDIFNAVQTDLNSLCHKNIFVEKNDDTGEIIRYTTVENEKTHLFAKRLDDIFSDSKYWFNWREELYRKALLAYGSSQRGSYYDEELLAEWRNLYDPENVEFKSDWENQFGIGSWGGYNPLVKTAPNTLRYWLDIIDSETANIGKYSVQRIGRRSKVIENSKINEIFPPDIPAVVFIENSGNLEKDVSKAEYYAKRGQGYSFVTKDTMGYFSYQDSFGSCYEDIRSFLYQNLIYNCSLQLNCIPILYLKVNSLVNINLKDLGIFGDYQINSIAYQFGINDSTMNIQLNEAITII